jgi:hypothetical protein
MASVHVYVALAFSVQKALFSLQGADGGDVLDNFETVQIPAIVSGREKGDVGEASAKRDA